MDTRKAFQFSDRTRNLGVEMGDLQLYDFFAGAIASVLDNNIDIHLSHRPIVTMNLSSDSDKRRLYNSSRNRMGKLGLVQTVIDL
jgi:hypothetical protein